MSDGLPGVYSTLAGWLAANSSQISDGAAALLVADRSYAEAVGLRARARIVSMAVAADDPVLQFTAILAATRAALDRAGLTIVDIDLAEVNEAFAPVPMLWRDEFGYPDDQLNVNGGSIAIGHPLGSTGGRLLTQLLDAVYEPHRPAAACRLVGRALPCETEGGEALGHADVEHVGIEPVRDRAAVGEPRGPALRGSRPLVGNATERAHEPHHILGEARRCGRVLHPTRAASLWNRAAVRVQQALQQSEPHPGGVELVDLRHELGR